MAGYFQRRAARKRLDALLTAAKTFRNLRGDLLDAETLDGLSGLVAGARGARKLGIPEMEEAARGLSDFLELHGAGRRNALLENFEVLAVAFAVAFAFRCYFFQPFQIPTGSMQPTLYGIHAVSNSTPTAMDRMPLKLFKWLVTGDWYTEVRVGAGGRVEVLPTTRKPGYVDFRVAGALYRVPSDAVLRGGGLDSAALRDVRAGTGGTMTIRSGGMLWAGTVKAGDHLFVNRLTWNFRPPRRGDVMVFSTQGIPALPQGTHYIKRMVGLPGESIAIDPPRLMVDGREADGPETIARIARRDRLAPWAPRYAGYQTIGASSQTASKAPLRTPADHFDLSPTEYFAMGDNTLNSLDSRYWGAVPRENLLGPGYLVYWPFTSPRWGRVE